MRMKRAVVLLALAVLGGVLLYGTAHMPPMGHPGNPDKVHVVPRYIAAGAEEAGASNLVAGVILNYRAYDTLAEVTVIFAALCAVFALLGREREGRCRSRIDPGPTPPSVVLQTVVRLLLPITLLFAGYIIFLGKFAPGGGFQAAAMIGSTVIVFTLIFGLPRATRRIPVRARLPLESSAVLVFLGLGFLAMALGANFLSLTWPGLSESATTAVRTGLMILLEAAIGVGGGVIFISIVFAMVREGE